MPSGSPASVRASGRLMPGAPEVLLAGVNATYRISRAKISSKSPAGSRYPILGVVCPSVGDSTTSNRWKTLRNSTVDRFSPRITAGMRQKRRRKRPARPWVNGSMRDRSKSLATTRLPKYSNENAINDQ